MGYRTEQLVIERVRLAHEWQATNVTIMDQTGLYVRYICQRCGAKGRRYEHDTNVRGNKICKPNDKERERD